MRRLTVLTLGVGMLAMSAPIAAHAASFDYRGGCGYSTSNDTTPGGPFGGQDVWNGEVHLLVVPTDTSANAVPTGAAVDVTCELRINGVSQGTVLSASGTGGVANAGQIQFTAAVTDVVSVCEHVTVGSETIVNCYDAKTYQVVPQAVEDVVNVVHDLVLHPVFDLLTTYCPPQAGNGACDTLHHQAEQVHTVVVCFALRPVALPVPPLTRRDLG